jgi:hypothetical protein
MKTIQWLTCALLSPAAVGVLAQSAGTANATGSADAQAPAFRCGGVGQEEQRQMKAEAGKHPLFVTFATAGGPYIADVDVEIRRAGKVVLQGHCGGPLMLVDLSSRGTYEIVATAQGNTQRKKVTLGARPVSVTMIWPGP